MDFLDKGIDTNALGSYWLKIDIDQSELPVGESITKIEVVCGDLKLSFLNPTFPLEVNLTAEQTRILKCGKNSLFVYGYDSAGKRFKFDGCYEFVAVQEV